MPTFPSRTVFAVASIAAFLLTACQSQNFNLTDDAEQNAARAMFAAACPEIVPAEMYYLTPKITFDYQEDTLSIAFPNAPFFPLKKISKNEQRAYLPYIFDEKADYRGLLVPGLYPRMSGQLIAIKAGNCQKIGPSQSLRYERRTS